MGNFGIPQLLAFVLINAAHGSLTVSEPIQLISVEVNLPWYIEFTFPPSSDLQPISLEADVYTEGVRTPLSFFLERKDKLWTLRNTQPYTFKPRDIIAGKLEFDVHPGVKRWIPIYYTITRNRRYDAILITESREILNSKSPEIAYTTPYPTTTATYFHPSNSKSIKTQNAVNCVPLSTTPEPVQSQVETKNSDSTVAFEMIADLNEEVNSLKDLVQTVLLHCRLGTKLILFGYNGTNSNLIDVIRHIVSDQLKLNDLEKKILDAKAICGGIVFEMSAPLDKARILTNAPKYLDGVQYNIKDADNHFDCTTSESSSGSSSSSSSSTGPTTSKTTTTTVATDESSKLLDFRIDELRRKLPILINRQ